MGHCSEVITLRMPDDRLNYVGVSDLDHLAAAAIVLRESPLLELLFLFIEQNVLLV
jgi:hypothetical protein